MKILKTIVIRVIVSSYSFGYLTNKHPASRSKYPEPSIQHPEPSIQHPESSIQNPESNTCFLSIIPVK
jgi:hypothetical protein